MLQRLELDAEVIPDLNEAPSDEVKCLTGSYPSAAGPPSADNLFVLHTRE